MGFAIASNSSSTSGTTASSAIEAKSMFPKNSSFASPLFPGDFYPRGVFYFSNSCLVDVLASAFSPAADLDMMVFKNLLFIFLLPLSCLSVAALYAPVSGSTCTLASSRANCWARGVRILTIYLPNISGNRASTFLAESMGGR